MNRTERVLKIVEELHASVLSPAAWTPALENMVDLFRSAHAFIATDVPGRPDFNFLAASGVDEKEIARVGSAEAIRMAGPITPALLPRGTVVTRASLWPDDDYARSDLYNEILRPIGGFDCVLFFEQRAPFGVSAGACRPANHFDSTEMANLQTLMPHLVTAVEMRHRFELAEHQSRSFAEVLDRLASGVILTDAMARPVFVNARAARIAESGGLIIDDTGLAGSSQAATHRLGEAIMAVAADTAFGSRNLHLERPSPRPPLLLTLMPISRLGIAVPGMRAPRVAILIDEPDAAFTIRFDVLAEVFRLTPRESEIATLICGGRDLAEIASALELGLGTVRHHLKHIYEKTGANSQAKLVALLRGFADR